MAPVPNCCIGAMVAPAALEELVELVEAPEAPDVEAVGVAPEAADEVVAETAVKLVGSICPQLAFSFFWQRAWAAASPTLAALQLEKICSQIKVGIVWV